MKDKNEEFKEKTGLMKSQAKNLRELRKTAKALEST
jgi:hypothetical protein